ncbi:MAG: AmmeMemoRadiSam system protein A [bacterium]|nr:AmmeMemoRadiSam system protein A [bacterium]
MTTQVESTARRGAVLLRLARRVIESELGLGGERADDLEADWLDQPAATFVTLHLDGRLRGCIGSLGARRTLREDVTRNALAAAFEDPRFPSLTAEELASVSLEVSILAPAEPMQCSSEDELLKALRPGVDGLVLECGAHRSTFLPQVWESCREPRRFVAALKRKAGLASDFWSEEIRFWRYTVEKFGED